MLRAKIDKNNNAVCPNCEKSRYEKSRYEIFRRDNLGEGIYLYHCKCGCGQLFIYKVDKMNNVIVDK